MGTLCAAHIFRREALRDNKSFFTALWDMAASLRLTIATLIILSVVSIIGTVLPQGRPPAEYVANYGENAYNLFSLLDFTDMYRSWWFLGLLVLFCLNLTACSAKRFPTVWRAIRNPNRTPDNSFYRNLSNREEFAVAAPAADVLERITAFMGTRFARPVSTREGGRIHLFAEKSPYARLGVYITHLSILVILVGAIIGNIWGFKAYVNIVEGTSADKVLPRDGGPPIELGFKLHVDEFDVKYYEGSSRPKEYMSVLNVIEDGQKVISGRKIVVNDPLTYKGITFYQSSYGSAGDPLFKLRVHPAGGEPFETTVPLGESVTLPDGSSYAVTNYAASYDQFGPAIQMHVTAADGRPADHFVVLQNHPDFALHRGGAYGFSLLGWDQLWYTGLQVNKDPGVWTVWVGCFLMVVGSLAAFFLSHRRIWVTLAASGSSTEVTVGGTAHRNQPAFELFFETFRRQLKEELREQSQESPDLSAVPANFAP
jgi:cytochrome c biogenesis protein